MFVLLVLACPVFHNPWTEETYVPDSMNTPDPNLTETPTPAPTSAPAFEDVSGLVVMEAENYTRKVVGTGDYSSHSWNVNNTESGASSSYYMEATPNDGTSVPPASAADSPVLEYDININTSEPYYFWVRKFAATGATDSCFVAVNSGPIYEWIFSATSWDWVDFTSSLTLNAGTNTIKIYMREAGAMIDKFILTTDSGYTPTTTGPDETRSN